MSSVMSQKKKQTKAVAFGGILCGLAVAVMLLSLVALAALSFTQPKRRVELLRPVAPRVGVVALLSGVGVAVFEQPLWNNIVLCLPELLYVGVFSSGVAYTLQILAQKDSDPTVVTILLSLESVFSVLAGAVLLGDRLSGREYLGCVLMFAAVILAQVPVKRKMKKG